MPHKNTIERLKTEYIGHHVWYGGETYLVAGVDERTGAILINKHYSDGDGITPISTDMCRKAD